MIANTPKKSIYNYYTRTTVLVWKFQEFTTSIISQKVREIILFFFIKYTYYDYAKLVVFTKYFSNEIRFLFHSSVWKNLKKKKKDSLTERIFVKSTLVKMLLSRNFCQKCTLRYIKFQQFQHCLTKKIFRQINSLVNI